MADYSRAAILTAGATLGLGLPLLLSSTARAQTEHGIHFACSAVEGQAEGYYANELGLFKRAGIAADFQTTRGGSATVTALVGGAVEVACTNPVSLGQALQRGIPLVILGTGAVWDTKVPSGFAITAPTSPVKTAKDLNGGVVGIPSLGGLNQLVMTAWIVANGGDLATIKFIEIPESATLEALNTGRIVASYLDEPQFSGYGNKVRPIGAASDAVAGTHAFAETVWCTTNDWLTKNKATARKVVDALMAGGKWAMANPVPAAKILQKQFSFDASRGKVQFATVNDPAAVQVLLDVATKYKFFPALKATDFYWNGK